MPPITPQPSHISHNWCMCTPSAPSNRPPPQQQAAIAPDLRGPARSSQPPNTAAEMPRTAMNNSNVTVSELTRQLHVVVNSSCHNDTRAQESGTGPASAFDSGNQNTENP